jgi:hypothetical protein
MRKSATNRIEIAGFKKYETIASGNVASQAE